jgi:hypothetical protein
VTDQATWERIAGEYRPALVRIGKAEPIEIIFDPRQVFRLGDSSPYLYLLQSMLLVLSKDHPTINQPPHNGVLDGDTSAALAGFQVLAGLEPTGELDRETWKFLSRQFTLNANHQVVRS